MKKNILFAILDLIFLAVFNTFFFTINGYENDAAVWIAYGFIHFAYIAMVLTPLFFKRKVDVHLFGASLLTISFIYFILELVLDSFLIFFGVVAVLPVILLNIVVSAAYFIVTISAVLATDSINENGERHAAERKYVKDVSAKLLALQTMAESRELSKKIGKAYEVISTSPARSDPTVWETENEISCKAEILRAEISGSNFENAEKTIDSIISLANQRNIMLKNNG